MKDKISKPRAKKRQWITGGSIFAVALAFLSFSPAASAAAISFAARVDSTAGTGPYSVASADFNGDGRMDLAVANNVSATVSVYLNNAGVIPATPSSTLTTGVGPYAVTSADFNGDGRPDLAVANETSNTVSVYINNAGVLPTTPSYTLTAGGSPTDVTAADFNGDGRLDLAVTNYNANTVSIYLNNVGTLPSTASYTLTTTIHPRDIIAEDVNGDGRPDLAVVNNGSNSVTVYINNAGVLPTTASYTLTTDVSPTSLISADFNGDGRPDLAVTNDATNSIFVYINNAGVLPTTTSQILFSSTAPFSLVAADFNGDGRPDLAVANYTSSTVTIFTNNAGVLPTSASSTLGTGGSPLSIISTDINGDGHPDLAVANNGANTVSVFIANGTFGPDQLVFSPISTTAQAGAPTSALTITARDVVGNVIIVGSNTVLALTDGGAGGQYSLTYSPFTPTGTATINAGSSTVVVYYLNNNPGVKTLNAHHAFYTDATATVTINSVGQYHQLTGRSVTLGSTKLTDNTADFQWHSAVNATIRAVRIQLCTTPIKSSPCVTPAGSSMSSTTLTSTGGQLGGGWSYTVNSNQDVLLTNATGAAVTIGSQQTVALDGFVNPSFYGTFYFRITTYSDVSGGPGYSLEYGAVATSTAKSITTTADVGETLVFRVANAVSVDCTSQTDVADPNDTTEDLVTLSPSPLSLTVPGIGIAQFCASSNAQNGYVISYHDEALGGPTKGFWDGAHEFGTLPSSPNGSGTFTQFTSTPGTEQFGFNLRNNGTFGADPDGAGLVADLINPDYATVARFSYNDTGASVPLAQKTSPNIAARYTISYVANIAPLTPGGTYSAHQVFVIVATY